MMASRIGMYSRGSPIVDILASDIGTMWRSHCALVHAQKSSRCQGISRERGPEMEEDETDFVRRTWTLVLRVKKASPE